MQTTRGIQQTLFAPPAPARPEFPPVAKGVVYTKRWVVDLLLDLAGYRTEVNLVDTIAVEPAAGDGAFLGPIIERLAESCQRMDRPLSDCRNSLLAYELNEGSADKGRALAVGILVDRGVDAALAQSLAAGWVRTGDYLFEATTINADFVIGNPPYIRLEEIPDGDRGIVSGCLSHHAGRADLYVAFFEAALHQLRQGGVCAFICADRWMRNQYGAELRNWLPRAYAVEVVVEMHNADAFDDEVDAYPAITVIRRRHQGPTVVASCRAGAQCHTSRILSDALHATVGGSLTQLCVGFTRLWWTHGSWDRTRGPAIPRNNWRCFAGWKTASRNLSCTPKSGSASRPVTTACLLRRIPIWSSRRAFSGWRWRKISGQAAGVVWPLSGRPMELRWTGRLEQIPSSARLF